MAEHTGSSSGSCISRMGSRVPAVESSLLVIHEPESTQLDFQIPGWACGTGSQEKHPFNYSFFPLTWQNKLNYPRKDNQLLYDNRFLKRTLYFKKAATASIESAILACCPPWTLCHMLIKEHWGMKGEKVGLLLKESMLKYFRRTGWKQGF